MQEQNGKNCQQLVGDFRRALELTLAMKEFIEGGVEKSRLSPIGDKTTEARDEAEILVNKIEQQVDPDQLMWRDRMAGKGGYRFVGKRDPITGFAVADVDWAQGDPSHNQYGKGFSTLIDRTGKHPIQETYHNINPLQNGFALGIFTDGYHIITKNGILDHITYEHDGKKQRKELDRLGARERFDKKPFNQFFHSRDPEGKMWGSILNIKRDPEVEYRTEDELFIINRDGTAIKVEEINQELSDLQRKAFEIEPSRSTPFSEGFALVGDKHVAQCYILKSDGTYVRNQEGYLVTIDINEHSRPDSFSDGLAAVMPYSYTGQRNEVYIEPDGKRKSFDIQLQDGEGNWNVVDYRVAFDRVADFRDGVAVVHGTIAKQERLGVLEKDSGRFHEIENVPKPDRIDNLYLRPFSNERAPITIVRPTTTPKNEYATRYIKPDGTFLCDAEGNIMEWRGGEGGNDFVDGMASVRTGHGWNVIDVDGNYLSHQISDEIVVIRDGLARITVYAKRTDMTMHGKKDVYWIDRTGEIMFDHFGESE